MRKKTKIILTVAIIGLIAGTLIKLTGNKTVGDIFLGLFTLAWLYVILPLIYNFITRKNKFQKL